MTEKPLFRAAFMDVFVEYEALAAEQRKEYQTLHGYQGLSTNKTLAIFKTNRLVSVEDERSGTRMDDLLTCVLADSRRPRERAEYS